VKDDVAASPALRKQCPASVGLHVSRGFDSRAAPELPFDDGENSVRLAGDEDATGIGDIVAATSLFGIGAFDRAAGESCGRRENGAERVAS